MKITRDDINSWLIMLAVALLIKIAYPEFSSASDTLVIGVVVFGLICWISSRRSLAKRKSELDRMYNDFMRKHQEIRRKYDPTNSWNESTTTPADYREEIRILNEQYQSIVEERRNR